MPTHKPAAGPDNRTENRTDNTAARKAALDILIRLEKTNELLDTVLDTVLHSIADTGGSARAGEAFTGFSPPDRKLINAIVYGVLRWRRRLDFLILQYAAQPGARISPEIMNILRMAVFQMVYLDRVPDFAVVNTSVEMAKRYVSVKSSRFVNGLLRNMLRNPVADIDAILPEDPARALAISQSFPDWLVRRWIARFGSEQAVRLCTAMNEIPPLTVRTNTLKTTRETLKAALAEACERIEATPYAPDGLCFYGPGRAIDQLDAFQRGWFQVQDEAAQLVTQLLDPQPGDKVLDACAGMGGKTGHIGQLMKNSGDILAADKDPRKLAKLESEMKRLGLSICRSSATDLDGPAELPLPADFDRILLDAPCSGIGVIRRNPDIKWAASKKNLSRFAGRQSAYLNKLAGHLAPSGTLLYVVCSIEPEETVNVIEKFLKNHPEFAMVTDTVGLSGRAGGLFDARGYFTSLPHRYPMDGFFAAGLKRK